MNVRAIAFDLDDTLLRDDRTISEYTVQVLKRASEQGICLIPASGRAQPSMAPYVDRLGVCDYYITSNGAEVWAGNHTILSQTLLEPDQIRQLFRFARDYDCYAHTYLDDCFFYTRMGKQAAEYEKAVHLRGIFRPEAASDWSIPSTKVLFIDQPEKIAELLETANSRFTGRFQITCSKPQFLEFNPLNATKGLALVQVADLLRIPMAEIAAFGDSLNDLSMLTAAGYGIAMGNARDDVKASVRHICRTNCEDGVAHYIEEYILSASEDL